jgi:hypothetical protein
MCTILKNANKPGFKPFHSHLLNFIAVGWTTVPLFSARDILEKYLKPSRRI